MCFKVPYIHSHIETRNIYVEKENHLQTATVKSPFHYDEAGFPTQMCIFCEKYITGSPLRAMDLKYLLAFSPPQRCIFENITGSPQ